MLARETIPADRISKDIWKDRFRDIRNYERYLHNNGIVVRKLYPFRGCDGSDRTLALLNP